MPSKIPYLTDNWAVVTGCDPCSPGCLNCFARGINHRFGRSNEVTVHPERLSDPLHWRKPRVVGVAFTADLFHDAVSFPFLAKAFDTVRLAARHTYLILTKRPAQMRDFFTGTSNARFMRIATPVWPPENLYLGVSVCVRSELWKIDVLRQTPAAHRWLSLEPLLEDLGEIDLTGIDWVVAGAESLGNRPGRRTESGSFWSLFEQCERAGIPFYLKQVEALVFEPKRGALVKFEPTRRTVPPAIAEIIGCVK